MIKGFIAGLAVANAFEWFAHKYLLHGVHRKGNHVSAQRQKDGIALGTSS
jgi:hypothetical protein